MRPDQRYITGLRTIYSQGLSVMARGRATRELLTHSWRFSMACPVITLAARKLNYRLMAAEAHWILSGRNNVFHHRMRPYSDEGAFLYGAYGPKFVMQLPFVVKELLNDRGSRRAVLSLWERSPDPASKDLPCTLTMQFLIRDNELHCVVGMRSSDAWLGIPYDLFSFSCMANLVRLHLRSMGEKVDLGDIFIKPGSAHIYKDDVDKIAALLDDNEDEINLVTDGIGQNLTMSFIDHIDPVDFVNTLGTLANAVEDKNATK